MTAQKLVDKRVADLEVQVSRGEPAKGSYLAYLLLSDRLSRAEVYISVTELMLGGVDTVRLYTSPQDEKYNKNQDKI